MNRCQKRKAKRQAKKAMNNIKSTANDVWSNIDDVTGDWADAAQDALKDAQKSAKSFSKDANKAVNKAGKKFDGFTDDAAKQADKFAKQAAKKTDKAVSKAGDRAEDFLSDASSFASDVVDNVGDFYDDNIAPFVNEVSKRAKPVVNKVRAGVEDAWEKALENEHVAEAAHRGESAVAALRGDNYVVNPQVAPKKNHWFRNVLVGVGVLAGVAALVAVLKNLLGSNDDGWTAQQPSQPYRKNDDAGWGDSPVEETGPQRAADVESVVDDVKEAINEMTSEGGQPNDDKGYGEGAYVGEEPPAEYKIKGNERSMKYHTEDAAGYDRTIADVWFKTEQDAEAAGFTRALR